MTALAAKHTQTTPDFVAKAPTSLRNYSLLIKTSLCKNQEAHGLKGKEYIEEFGFN
jgi:hypothetical protein